MIVLGLTGSIGMGKSTASNMLRYLNVPVSDADEIVHGLLSPKGEVMTVVAQTFPECWNKKKRAIDRKILGQIVFEDAAKREKLEQIIHPFVQLHESQFLKKCKRLGRDIAVLDIPLLFETQAERRVDYTIVVTAPFFVQAQRVLSRPFMSLEKFNAILDRQLSDQEKRMRADFVVHTSMGRYKTMQQLKSIIKTVTNTKQKAYEA